MRQSRPPALVAVLAATLAALLTLVGCGASTKKPGGSTSGGNGSSASAGGSSTGASGSTSGSGASCTPGQPSNPKPPASLTLKVPVDSAAAAKLPASIKSNGTIVVASDLTYPPNEFLAVGSSKPIGMDIDFANALGSVLGVKMKIVNVTFDGILAGIKAGRYDVGISSLTDTKDREHTVNFVTYFKAGISTMVKKCNPLHITGDLSLCGKKVGAENSTTELDALTKPNISGSIVTECKKAGKPAPQAQGFPTQTDVNSALAIGRIDAYSADTPVIDYALSQNSAAFQKAGTDTGIAPYGIAMAKTSGTLDQALQLAVEKLMSNGDYKKILDNWGVQAGAIDKSVINGAIS